MITQTTEHPAVLETCRTLERLHGARVTVLPVGSDGLLSPAALAAAFTEDTVLASVMAANNETGALQPIAELAALARTHGALFHRDAVQAVHRPRGSPHVMRGQSETQANALFCLPTARAPRRAVSARSALARGHPRKDAKGPQGVPWRPCVPTRLCTAESRGSSAGRCRTPPPLSYDQSMCRSHEPP